MDEKRCWKKNCVGGKKGAAAAKRLVVPLSLAFLIHMLALTTAFAWGQKPNTASVQGRNLEAQLQKKLDHLFDDLAPVSGGTGVIVFEPTGSGVDEPTLQFAAGCSRWLQFVVGGQAELGKTPTWASIDSVREELGLANLRAPLLSAVRIARTLGATHVAVGEVSGTRGKMEINYHLYTLSSQQPLLNITLSGDESTIVNGLPGTALKLARSAGAAIPHTPGGCAAGPSGLRAIGAVAWIPSAAESAEDLKALEEVAGRDPCAALLTLFAASGPDEAAVIAGARQTLARVAMENAIAQHTLMAAFPGKLQEAPANLRKALEASPRNYNIVAAMTRCAEMVGDAPGMLQSARQAVRIAPSNARAWTRLADAYGKFGDSIRRARLANDITPSEWEKLDDAYLRWTMAAKAATDLDPAYAYAWQELATAACFAGAHEVADTAYWRAIKLDSNDATTLNWGLEMYQPKWMDDSQKLDRVVSIVVTAEYQSKQNGAAIAKRLVQVNAKYKADSDKLLARIEKEAKEILARTPGNRDATAALVTISSAGNRPAETAQYLLALVRQNPEDESLLIRLSRVAGAGSDGAEIGRALKAAVDKHAGNTKLQLAYGHALLMMQDFDGAVKELKRVPAASSEYKEAQSTLASALELGGHLEQATDQFREMARRSPDSDAAQLGLIRTLGKLKRNAEAVDAARAAKQARPDSLPVRGALAEALFENMNYAAAAEEYRYLAAREDQKPLRARLSRKAAECLTAGNQKPGAIKAYVEALQDEANPVEADAIRRRIRELGGTAADLGGGSIASAADAIRISQSFSGNDAAFAISVLKDAVVRWPNDSALTGEFAMQLIAAKQYSEAETMLREALKKAPGDNRLRLSLANALSFQGRHPDALAVLEEAQKLKPDDTAVASSRLALLSDLQRRSEAEAVCRKLLAADPKSLWLHQMLAKLTMERGKFAEAMAECETLLTLDDRKSEAPHYRIERGRALMGLGRLDEALQAWQAALDEDPGGPYSSAAKLYLGDPKIGAPHALQESATTAHAPGKPRAAGSGVPARSGSQSNSTPSAGRAGGTIATSGRGSVGTGASKPAAPNGAATNAILQPRPLSQLNADMQANYDKAEEMRRTGKNQEALELYAAVLKASPGHPESHLGFGQCLFFTGKAVEALPELRRAAESLPQNSDALYYYGAVLKTTGATVEAVRWMRKAAELVPDDMGKSDDLADTLIAAKQPDEAIAVAARIKARYSNYGLYTDRVARAYEAKGQNDAALKEWKAGIEGTKETFFQSLYRIGAGRLLWKMERKDEARAQLRAAIDIAPEGIAMTARSLLDSWKGQ